MDFDDPASIALARAELAPDGILRAGINLGNPLLVSRVLDHGEPVGIAPDIARAVADALSVPCRMVPFDRPGETADAVEQCGIVLIAVEVERAKTIAFSPGYVEIEATYLVKPEVSLDEGDSVDREGIRIVVSERSAYDLWLTRNIRHADILRVPGIAKSIQYFKDQPSDVLAGLKPALIQVAADMPGSRILPESFSRVQQAVGTAIGNRNGAGFLDHFVSNARRDGLVAEIVQRNGVEGLAVPQADPA